MIKIKSKSEIEKMRLAGVIAANALHTGGMALRPGVSTEEINAVISDYITKRGGVPSFLGYRGFPKAACISLNDQVIHGIPSKRVKLKEGDIVSVDVGVYLDGFHADTAFTFAVGEISEEAASLLKATEECLYLGIKKAAAGNRIGDISGAIEENCARFGYSPVKDYVGHGVGRELHEDPEVPNFGKPSRGPRIISGMTIAIEPMINAKGSEIKTLSDGWTVVTGSGSLSAHFEHTVAVTPDGPLILTAPDL